MDMKHMTMVGVVVFVVAVVSMNTHLSVPAREVPLRDPTIDYEKSFFEFANRAQEAQRIGNDVKFEACFAAMRYTAIAQKAAQRLAEVEEKERLDIIFGLDKVNELIRTYGGRCFGIFGI